MESPKLIDSSDVEGATDWRGILLKIASRPWWLVASIVVFSAAFAITAFALTPIYRASIVLIPAKSDKDADSNGSGLGGIGGVASLVGINLGESDALTQEALAVLRSRQFNEKFISDLNLMPILFAKKWDATNNRWKVDEDRQPTPARAYTYFVKKVRSVAQEKKTNLITVNIDWPDRMVAAKWANEIVQRLNLEMRKRAIDRADSAVGYLEKEFESTNAVATREAIGHLIESQVKQRMLAAVTPEFVFRVIDPALPPDSDDRYFPPRLGMVIAGPIVGLLIGILCILGYDALTENVKSRQTENV